MGATQHRPGSHSSRPKRTGAVALDDSIADGGSEIKRRGRANGALERANLRVKWPFSAPINATGVVRGACEACVPWHPGGHNQQQSKMTFSPKHENHVTLPFFNGFSAFSGFGHENKAPHHKGTEIDL